MHESILITPKYVIEHKLLFNIPIYQRLYVWGGDQVKVLLDDLVVACEAGKDVFYLGGTLVIEQQRSIGELPLFDLIDGQQRFTTLWLLSLALERLVAKRGKGETNLLAGFRSVMCAERLEPRIRFAIRPEVTRFFDALLNGAEVPDVPAASSLSRAITEIEGYFNDHRTLSLTKLSAFICDKVQLVLTQVPPQTDLNKLFEVINNRGVQLQHHEILKARLLGGLQDSRQREIFGQVWDACSHMSDYVEKNLRTVAGIKLIPLYGTEDATTDNEGLADPVRVRQAIENIYKGKAEQVLTLDEILNGGAGIGQDERQSQSDEEYQSDVVRSIITFSMLLQHVLRIFLLPRGRDIDRVLDKDLLKIFETHWLDGKVSPAEREHEIMEFVDLLWRCRYLFDKYVIKWVENDDEEEIHAIRRLRVNSSRGHQSLIRESRDADTAFAMLQSMLYHSQQLTTHYWLTPLLNYLLEHGGDNAHLYLKYLDNYLLCSATDEPLIQRTNHFLRQPWCAEYKLVNIAARLNKDEGTGFSHYWFYKLEYILWEKYRNQKGAAWQAFRMTAKNSVEHVSPQKAQEYDTNRVSAPVLDTFGNLALVSRGVNSEYGNKPYVEKQARFGARNAGRADSLKLALIYEKKYWNDDRANEHRAQMIGAYQDYFADVDKAVNQLRHSRGTD